VLRIVLHPGGLGSHIANLTEWGRHVAASLEAHGGAPGGAALISELRELLPPLGDQSNPLGFAVPLQLSSREGDLMLITTLTSFATAVDVTLPELTLEAFLPADAATAERLARLVPRTPSVTVPG
jgi:hypothetical protein